MLNVVVLAASVAITVASGDGLTKQEQALLIREAGRVPKSNSARTGPSRFANSARVVIDVTVLDRPK